MSIDHRQWSCRQHAYNKGKSTETELHELVEYIEGSLNVGEHAVVIFLYIEEAFNSINPNLCVNENIIGYLLTKRRVSATLGTANLKRFVKRATPQGGVISPLLWNVAMNNILLSLEEVGAEVVAYAGDLAIEIIGMSPSAIRDILQRHILGHRKTDWE